jgi:transposase-like protein
LLFSEDLSATQIYHLTGLSRQTINKYLTAIRLRILELSLLQSDPLVGQIEVDESYFGAWRVRGKRGRGARAKTIIFGLLKRGDQVYTEIVPNCKSTALQRIIKGKTSIDSVIHSDGWRGYNWLKDETGLGRFLDLIASNDCRLSDYAADKNVLPTVVREFKNNNIGIIPSMVHLVNIELWLRSLNDGIREGDIFVN